MSQKTIAIVGASLAGGQAALTLRERGFDGRVVLVGGEPHPPYERPPLSKDVLLGLADPSTTALVAPSVYEELDIDLVLGVRATQLRPDERRVVLADGRNVDADQILLATGARPRPIGLPGDDRAGVHDLRTLDDALELRDQLVAGAHVVVIGAGFIGAEVASIARKLGCEVALVEVAQLPLQRMFGPEFGRLYAAMHAEHGVELHLGSRPVGIAGAARCSAVELDDGTLLPADVVVCGVGVTPATELGAASGALVDNGVVVDGRCRTTVPGVFAAGDVAARPSSYASGRVRLESWQNALKQGGAAAASMLGAAADFDELPWFWSDQYDINLQLAGLPNGNDTVVWRGEPDSFDATAFYLREGTVVAAAGLNRAREVRAAMDLIRKRVRIEPDDVRDETTDLRALARRPDESRPRA